MYYICFLQEKHKDIIVMEGKVKQMEGNIFFHFAIKYYILDKKIRDQNYTVQFLKHK